MQDKAQKAPREKFLKDIEIFKAISTAIKKFEDDHQQAVASNLELITLQENLQEMIEQFTGKKLAEYAPLLMQLNNFNKKCILVYFTTMCIMREK